MLNCRLAGPGDLPRLRSVDARWEGRDYVFDVLPDWIQQRPGGVYIYEYQGEVAGFSSIAFPKPGEAWLRGKRIDRRFEGRGVGTATTRFEIDEAIRLGARVIRLAAHEDNAAVHHMIGNKLGFKLAARRVIGSGLTVTGDDARPGSRPSQLRVRRFSSSQWHNPRVRLAVQMAIEQYLPREGEGSTGPGHGPWGLIAVPDDPWQFASFGPMDLMDAFSAGEVVVAGDPVQPQGVMFLREPARDQSHPWGFIMRLLVGTPQAIPALLEYVAGRCRALSGWSLSVSLPEASAGTILDRLQPSSEIGVFFIYESTVDR